MLVYLSPKRVSDKHRISKLKVLIKSWAARPFMFQWQNLIGEDFLGPGFVSILSEFKKYFRENSIKKQIK